MLERFNENINVKHEKGATKEERNKKRDKEISSYVSNNFSLEKNTFNDWIDKNYTGIKQDEVKEKVSKIDFNNAKPTNKTFVNEMKLAGESMFEGFLEVFNIERNKAVDQYKNRLHYIETQENEDEPRKSFVGKFRDNKLVKVTPYKDNKEELSQYIQEKKNIENQNKKQDQKQQIGLTRQREED